ncbi:MAG TPA: hypothetical protein VII63_08995 [Caulobacteraceae bacterium]
MSALRYLVAAAAMAAVLPTVAQTTQQHVRGKVGSLAGNVLVVRGAHGGATTVQLSGDWSVVVMRPVDVATIQPGSFIGTTEFEKPDGTGQSLEVHVFPPGVKIGEGHYPWDLKPRSMMTNGTIGKVTAVGKGRMLEVGYPGGMRRILVPVGVPVVATAPGDRSMIKKGVNVFIAPAKLADGSLGANRVLIGENGAAPPM